MKKESLLFLLTSEISEKLYIDNRIYILFTWYLNYTKCTVNINMFYFTLFEELTKENILKLGNDKKYVYTEIA